MNARQVLLSFTALVLTLSGCGKDEVGGQIVDGVDKQAFKVLGVGTWSACHDAGMLSSVFQLPKVTEEYAYGASLQKTTTFSLDCTSASITVTEDGRYETVNKVANMDRTYEINQTFDSVKITARDDAGRDKLNALKICGRTDWAVGVTRDVTGDSSALNNCWVKTPRSIYDISKVDGNDRKFGVEDGSLDKTTNEKRPKALNDDLIFNRKK